MFSGSRRLKQAADRERLEELDRRMAAIGRSQAVIEFDLDGTIRDANDNLLQTMGYGLDEIRGQHHRMFMDPAEAATSDYAAFWRELNEGRFVARKFRRIAKGGREVWLEASYNPVLDEAGRPLKVVKLAVDITEAEQASQRAEQARLASEAGRRSGRTAFTPVGRRSARGHRTGDGGRPSGGKGGLQRRCDQSQGGVGAGAGGGDDAAWRFG